MVRGRKRPLRHNDLKETRDPIKILVVEDDPDFGDTLCETLTMSGYRAAYAVDGIAALEMLRNGDDLPDLILLDVMLPRMDGWGFREAQLGDKRLKDIPVVVFQRREKSSSRSTPTIFCGNQSRPKCCSQRLSDFARTGALDLHQLRLLAPSSGGSAV